MVHTGVRLLGAALKLATMALAQELFCTFTNDNGDHCRVLDSQYSVAWCTGRARGVVGGSCLRVWVAAAGQQVFEEAAGPDAGAGTARRGVDWAAQQGEAEHAQLAMRWVGRGCARAVRCGAARCCVVHQTGAVRRTVRRASSREDCV